MLNSRTKTFVSVVTLIIYGTLALASVPLHFHQDGLLSTGSGEHAFAQHDDAFHCEHHSIESHADCTLCSVVTQFHHSAVVAVVPLTDPVMRECGDLFQSYTQHHLTNALSRRGPPTVTV